jgi:arylsulfatase A-like enzyme
MVRTADWKLMMANAPDAPATDALYDLRNDPGETRNLLGAAAGGKQCVGPAAEMKDRLTHWLERVQSPYLEGVKQRRLG